MLALTILKDESMTKNSRVIYRLPKIIKAHEARVRKETGNPTYRLTNLALEAATGIHRNLLSGYRNHQPIRVDLNVLAKLCDFFGVTPGDILQLVPGDNQED